MQWLKFKSANLQQEIKYIFYTDKVVAGGAGGLKQRNTLSVSWGSLLGNLLLFYKKQRNWLCTGGGDNPYVPARIPVNPG